MNKCLVILLISCLIISLILPAIDAAATRRKQRGRSKSRVSSARRSQAKALRAARQRQAARRQGRWEEGEGVNEPLEYDDSSVVEDEGAMPSVPGLDSANICEAVIFTKDEGVIDFKFVKNNC
jgi:hypothetical protein